ncbi:hypothetical protein MNEG_8461 [Monoraphidium neglectum]|uniref:Uncharacterized protein n=1 Tax=Monoraphidium neglectum TaxID=145388 RepID=A0A0D2KVU4_9CHLO|nr:hypothetical protein MNEG_8461 [Monoraphidium neglectum]KIY99498.1 hypothetical protein MNEG_8461 [Monoraphidium neglectum]|eukprot:XP_013898518.1 hypothetical protein MNEG_8461 [Monoraphidium neglectum]
MMSQTALFSVLGSVPVLNALTSPAPCDALPATLSKATSPKTVNILSSPGGVTIRGGGVPPYNLTYLTPLPLAKSTAGRVRRWLKKDRQAHPNAIEPQGLFPWGSGFVYPFTTNITTAGDALLTIDAGLSVPVRWWWYRIIPWVLKFQVTDSTGNGATGSIAVFINPF